MTTTHSDPRDLNDELRATERTTPQSDLGWEGHVHFPNGVPLWKRVLDSWPELRTGLAYCLVFASGVLLGSGITALYGYRRSKEHLSSSPGGTS